MKQRNEFMPDWYEGLPPEGSYRSIFKWGAPDEFKHPNKHLYRLMRKVFHMSDLDFMEKQDIGHDRVQNLPAPRLDKRHADALTEIVGAENARSDDYSRLQAAYGKTMLDLMRLRKKIAENLPDIVLHPRNINDLDAIVAYCNTNRIPVYVYGGGSSVTRGFEAVMGGVTLDMRVHMKRVIAFNEVSQTVTVEAGMSGPELERLLNNAPDTLGAKRRYTCGHLPQSFEYSVVGGWVVTRGAGQNSTYYGNANNMVMSQEYVTPVGRIRTPNYPSMATGPDVDELMMGSEGAFGILAHVTLRIHRYMPENTRRYSYIFRSWEQAKEAAREIMQGEFGYPSVFRLSDPEETDVALKLYGIEGTPIDSAMKILGYKPMERCLLLGTSDGDAAFTSLVKRRIHHICRAHGAMCATAYTVKQWEHSRFRDPYMRDDLQDYGIMTDTLECTVRWDNLEEVHSGVRDFCKSRPDTICMTHMSHFYPQGCNLYFIFIAKMNDIDEYLEYQKGILDAIQKCGASMSHHHGIGKAIAPWLEGHLGPEILALYRSLKKHFDPNGIMNPGGTLALDEIRATSHQL